MTLLADRLLEIHHDLDEAEIRHAFGGAIALAYWTLDPRGTSDIDVNIFVPAADPEPALEVLPQGIARDETTVERIVRDGQIRLWWDQTPVDLFFTNLPIHEDAARHVRFVPFAGDQIPVLGPVELAVFKTMFDRTRDWADIEAMLVAETVDVDALRGHLIGLVGEDDHRLGRLAESIARADADSATPR